MEGGRKRVSDTFTHRDSSSCIEEHNHCFMHCFGVKALFETFFSPPLMQAGYGARYLDGEVAAEVLRPFFHQVRRAPRTGLRYLVDRWGSR